MTDVNVKLLRKIADRLEKQPNKYGQGSWVSAEDCAEVSTLGDLVHSGGKKFLDIRCGATACVAGHAVLMSQMPLRNIATETGRGELGGRINWLVAGAESLGIDASLGEWLFDAARREKSMPYLLRAIADGMTDRDALMNLEDALYPMAYA